MVSLIIWLCPCQRIDYIQLFYVVNRIELREAIKDTKQEIEAVKFQLEQSQDNKEIRKLEKRLKELQVLQLWHLGLLDNNDT